MTSKEKILLLYSGGSDCTLLLKWVQKMEKDVLCLGVNYGQKHVIELDKAEELCNSMGVGYSIINIPLCDFVKSTLLPDNRIYENVSEHYVPSRNLIFVSLAVSIAESNDIDTIWIGCDYSDRIGLFPDCYQEWIVKLNELLQINGSTKIKIEAPLLGWSKERVLEMLSILNVEGIHSGYAVK